MMATGRMPEGARGRPIRARLTLFDPSRLLPAETRRHLRNANREQLLALRSLIDAAAARLEERERELVRR